MQNYAAGMSCYQATVSCPNTADIGVTYGYLAPPGTIQGTVFFHGGGDGTEAQDISDFAPDYLGAGYALVQMSWATQWENTGLTTLNVGYAAWRGEMRARFQRRFGRGGLCAGVVRGWKLSG
jgi:hypothetical protein